MLSILLAYLASELFHKLSIMPKNFGPKFSRANAQDTAISTINTFVFLLCKCDEQAAQAGGMMPARTHACTYITY